MKALMRIPRGLHVLIVAAVLAVLVWRFAPADLLFPFILGALVILIVAAALIYRFSGPRAAKDEADQDRLEPDANLDSASEPAPDSESHEVLPFNSRTSGTSGVRRSESLKMPSRPRASDEADRYMQIAHRIKAEEEARNTWQPKAAPVQTSTETAPAPGAAAAEETAEKAGPQALQDLEPSESASGVPNMPIICDESVLTEAEKSELENAVWYRCENPFCKYTHFLDVHHIVDEKDGGTNKLDNLIVLCPYCHDLAHRLEIPEKAMHDWISNRQERFKFKLEWHYH